MALVPQVKFYLESSKQGRSRREERLAAKEIKEIENGPAVIFLYVRFRSKTLKATTGRKCARTAWDAKKQRINPRRDRNYLRINSFLDKVSHEVAVLFDTAIANKGQIPEKREIVALIERLSVGKIAEVEGETTLLGLLERFMDTKRPLVRPGTLQRYTALRKHLSEFRPKRLYLVDVNQQFYSEFLAFLYMKQRIQNSTAGKLIIGLKTFLAWCAQQGLKSGSDFKRFQTPTQSSRIIALNSDELRSLLNLDLKREPRLDRTRDLFCFACLTGLRHSDILKLDKTNFQKNELQVTTQKTRDQLSIPLVGDSYKLAKKYKFKLPRISNQKMNQYLKELGQLAHLNTQISITEFRGPSEDKRVVSKWELLTFHTARKTFISLSLELGVRPETVMSITGHKDFRTMRPYIRVAKRAREKELISAWNKIKS